MSAAIAGLDEGTLTEGPELDTEFPLHESAKCSGDLPPSPTSMASTEFPRPECSPSTDATKGLLATRLLTHCSLFLKAVD
jgi:hypothetical protein